MHQVVVFIVLTSVQSIVCSWERGFNHEVFELTGTELVEIFVVSFISLVVGIQGLEAFVQRPF